VTVYYFAARFSRNAEMRRYRARLCAYVDGAEVSARWIDPTGDPDPCVGERLNADPARAWEYARADLEDINRADVLVEFTETPDAPGGFPSAGGRHVEFGYALAVREEELRFPGPALRLVIVGPRENVFHAHPAVEVFADFDAFLAHECRTGGGA
jgi:hypothetical protein